MCKIKKLTHVKTQLAVNLPGRILDFLNSGHSWIEETNIKGLLTFWILRLKLLSLS